MKKRKITCICFSLALWLEVAVAEKNNHYTDLNIAPTSVDSLFKKENKYKFASTVKLNTTQLLFRNISLQYELAFHQNISVSLGYSNYLERPLSKIIYRNKKTDGFQRPDVKGYYLTPEVRLYLPFDEEKMANGVYLAAYMRYSKYSVAGNYIHVDQQQQTTNYQMKGVYKGSTFGLMAGSQWAIANNLTFDWWIAGLGFGRSKLGLEVLSDGNGFSSSTEQSELKNSIIGNIDQLNRFTSDFFTIEMTPNSAKLEVRKIPMVSVRGFGFNFGFRF